MGRERVLDPLGERADDRRFDRLESVFQEKGSEHCLEQRR
jgi:hypothetical protein